MSWNRDTIQALSEKGLFHDRMHLSRFKELTDVYGNEPFFSSGLCKCMYLSSWDDEHFGVILEMLNQMHIGKNPDLEAMDDNGKELIDVAEQKDYYILLLSFAFIRNESFDITCLPKDLDADARFIITQALDAAIIIDDYN